MLPLSRPGSRHAYDSYSVPGVDDQDAFPTLGSMSGFGNKGPGSSRRHHGKRGAAHKPESPSSLAEIVRNAPSPSPAQSRGGRGLGGAGRGQRGSTREHTAAVLAIPPPQDLPWVATGDAVNKAYVKARSEAFKHMGQRNKLLQGAAQAYNRQDARAAKALSIRGQAENNLMREAHRRAAQILYDERNKDAGNHRELYIDLHGTSLILRRHD
jgi:hypothetical protein